VQTDMPTKKKETAPQSDRPPVTAAYEEAIANYTSGVETMQQGDFTGARDLFEKVRAVARHEPELGDRATIYARICERKLTPPADESEASGDRYRQAVFLLNSGQVDGALQLLNRLQADAPMDVDVLYVRACAWAVKGAVEKAVGDLRQAMAVDPKVRFQAVNDPDFERIREEPAFIDIIEPTLSGA
jgi:Flp pilus assembly protein TadD